MEKLIEEVKKQVIAKAKKENRRDFDNLFIEFMNKNNGCLGKIINEAIEELEQYEQNFKQKEFKYRTECQNTLSTERVESDNMTDKLAELEKLILDYYLAKGYKVGVGDWGFEVDIYSRHKFKNLTVLFSDQLGTRPAFTTTTRISSDMWDKAIDFFSLNEKQYQYLERKQ